MTEQASSGILEQNLHQNKDRETIAFEEAGDMAITILDYMIAGDVAAMTSIAGQSRDIEPQSLTSEHFHSSNESPSEVLSLFFALTSDEAISAMEPSVLELYNQRKELIRARIEEMVQQQLETVSFLKDILQTYTNLILRVVDTEGDHPRYTEVQANELAARNMGYSGYDAFQRITFDDPKARNMHKGRVLFLLDERDKSKMQRMIIPIEELQAIKQQFIHWAEVYLESNFHCHLLNDQLVQPTDYIDKNVTVDERPYKNPNKPAFDITFIDDDRNVVWTSKGTKNSRLFPTFLPRSNIDITSYTMLLLLEQLGNLIRDIELVRSGVEVSLEDHLQCASSPSHVLCKHLPTPQYSLGFATTFMAIDPALKKMWRSFNEKRDISDTRTSALASRLRQTFMMWEDTEAYNNHTSQINESTNDDNNESNNDDDDDSIPNNDGFDPEQDRSLSACLKEIDNHRQHPPLQVSGRGSLGIETLNRFPSYLDNRVDWSPVSVPERTYDDYDYNALEVRSLQYGELTSDPQSYGFLYPYLPYGYTVLSVELRTRENTILKEGDHYTLEQANPAGYYRVRITEQGSQFLHENSDQPEYLTYQFMLEQKPEPRLSEDDFRLTDTEIAQLTAYSSYLRDIGELQSASNLEKLVERFFLNETITINDITQAFKDANFYGFSNARIENMKAQYPYNVIPPETAGKQCIHIALALEDCLNYVFKGKRTFHHTSQYNLKTHQYHSTVRADNGSLELDATPLFDPHIARILSNATGSTIPTSNLLPQQETDPRIPELQISSIIRRLTTQKDQFIHQLQQYEKILQNSRHITVTTLPEYVVKASRIFREIASNIDKIYDDDERKIIAKEVNSLLVAVNTVMHLPEGDHRRKTLLQPGSKVFLPMVSTQLTNVYNLLTHSAWAYLSNDNTTQLGPLEKAA